MSITKLAILPSQSLPKKGDSLLLYKNIKAAVPLASQAISTSYDNLGGTGDRRAVISITHSGGWHRTGGVEKLINGIISEDNLGLNMVPTAGCEIIFDFGVARVIQEARMYKWENLSHGFWTWQGRNSSSGDWSGTLGAPTLLTGTLCVFPFPDNNTAYRYYRMVGISGTVADDYFYEVEFKIDDGT